MSSIIRAVTGYCPYLDIEYSITVRYAVIRFAGQSEPGYKPLDSNCDESDSCPYANDNKCPIYEDELKANT